MRHFANAFALRLGARPSGSRVRAAGNFVLVLGFPLIFGIGEFRVGRGLPDGSDDNGAEVLDDELIQDSIKKNNGSINT